MMGAFRRIGALATGVLVLQLTLLGAAAPCADHGVGGLADASHEQSGHANVPATDVHEDCDGDPAQPTGKSSGGSCIAMISCATPMLQFGAELSVAGGNVINTLVVVAFLEPPTHTTAPELPPPRA